MNTRDLNTLYEYTFWANRRILDAAARVTPEQFIAATPLGLGTLRNTLVHLLDDSIAWRNLCQTGTTEYFGTLKPETFPTLDTLLPLWDAEERTMREYLSSLTDDDLTRPIAFEGPDAQKIERPVWLGLYHITNHATEHRSAAAAILTAFGHPPGELDLIELWNEQG